MVAGEVGQCGEPLGRVEAALPPAFSQSQGCASAEALLTYSEDDQPRYGRHHNRNEYRISPKNLSLLQKAVYSVSFVLTSFTHQITQPGRIDFSFPIVCT